MPIYFFSIGERSQRPELFSTALGSNKWCPTSHRWSLLELPQGVHDNISKYCNTDIHSENEIFL